MNFFVSVPSLCSYAQPPLASWVLNPELVTAGEGNSSHLCSPSWEEYSVDVADSVLLSWGQPGSLYVG